MNLALQCNRLSFGSGTLGCGMSATLVSMCLMFYPTRVLHISQSATVVVTVVLVAIRISGAPNDPLMGVIIGNARSRFGKFKPWITLGTVSWGAAALGISVDLGTSGAAFLVWFIVVHPAWSAVYTTNDTSFWGMLPTLSQDLEERKCIGVIARIRTNLGLSSVVVTVMPMTKALGGLPDSRQLGWLAFVALLVVLILGFQPLTLLFTRQQTTVAASQTLFRELVRAIGRNDQLSQTAGAVLCFMGGYMIVISLGVYYFRCVYRDEATYSVFAVILAVMQLAGLALFPLVQEPLRRFQTHTLATLLCLVGLVVFQSAGSSLTVVAVTGMLLFTGQAFIQLLMLMLIVDCAEYGQWKLGRHSELTTLAVQPFVYKTSNAIGSGFVGLALLVFGVSGARAVEDMAVAGVAAFKSVILLIPMMLIATSWLILRVGYRLGEKRCAKIPTELEGGEAST